VYDREKMSENLEKFVDSVRDTIDFFRDDYDLTVGEVIGALEIIKRWSIRALEDITNMAWSGSCFK